MGVRDSYVWGLVFLCLGVSVWEAWEKDAYNNFHVENLGESSPVLFCLLEPQGRNIEIFSLHDVGSTSSVREGALYLPEGLNPPLPPTLEDRGGKPSYTLRQTEFGRTCPITNTQT